MWFVLSFVWSGYIVCCGTGKTLAAGVQERGAGRYLGLRGGECQDISDNYIIRNFVVCTSEQILLR